MNEYLILLFIYEISLICSVYLISRFKGRVHYSSEVIFTIIVARLSLVSVYTKRRLSNSRVFLVFLVYCCACSLSICRSVEIFSFDARNIPLVSWNVLSFSIRSRATNPISSFSRCVTELLCQVLMVLRRRFRI